MLSGGCSLLRFGRKGTEIKLPLLLASARKQEGSNKISALTLFSLSYADAALPMFARKHLAPDEQKKSAHG